MSYVVARSAELPSGPWNEMTGPLATIIGKFNATKHLICGPSGEGPPVLTSALIHLNGNINRKDHARHLGKLHLPVHDGDRDDAHEDFELCRLVKSPGASGQYVTNVTTRRKPYDLAVRASLLTLRHFFPDETFIHESPATMDEWTDAWIQCRGVIHDMALPEECRPNIVNLWVTPQMLRFHSNALRAGRRPDPLVNTTVHHGTLTGRNNGHHNEYGV